jgi:hypothetical protein
MDFPVLKYVDILIGLALVMVLLSTVVLAMTQTLLAWVFARSRHLRRGLERLINQLEPETLRPHSPYLARLLLRHPLIGQWTVLSYLRRLREQRKLVKAHELSVANRPTAADVTLALNEAVGPNEIERADEADVVADVPPAHPEAGLQVLPALSAGSVLQREELAYLLIELAAGEGPLMDPLATGVTPPSVAVARQALADALRRSGIEDPAATLRAIRAKVVENERSQPDLPASRWRSNAIADCAPCDFVAKLHASFDNTMARVTDAFSGESRLWVVAASLLLVVGLQLDTFALVKRLSVDDKNRDAFVAAAQELVKDPKALDSAVTSSLAEVGTTLDLLPIIVPPASDGYGRAGPYLPDWKNVPGVLFSWVLLSLGAPFWFDALKNLLKLRSVLAKQDDKDRETRQTAGSPSDPKAQAAASRPAPDSGEAGDLSATGVVG